MIGVDQKHYEMPETVVTVSADGTTLDAGATITFQKAFRNIPSAVVIPPLGTVDLDDQVGTVWTLSALSKTGCTIDVTTLPDNFFGKDIRVAVFAHEQL